MTGAFFIRVASACMLFVGIAFVQDPGYLAPDTKFDLVVAPGEFLARALHLWDGEAAFGQLQNQAYGYLWPMGPFFLLGSVLDVPGWVVQRLWMALVLCVAFTGTVRVTRELGVRSDLACLLAGFAFALSPRMLTTLGPISIEAWPSALAPWVLFFLVRGSATGSPRRAAALAALAVAMVGGVNAAATFAVLPLGVVWLLTRTPGPRRRSMMLWWPALTLVGTLWWVVPLLVMGAYSPPFLNFIETTSVTTFPTTLFDVLRGTSNWVPYVDVGSRAGNDLLSTPYLVLNSGVVLLLGVLGLADSRTPHRRFLVLAVLLGVLMVAAGHRGAVEGWFAGDVRGLLDGVLAPLRNVHKFDPILRLPLVIGLAWVVERVVQERREEPVAAHEAAPDLDAEAAEHPSRSLTRAATALNRFSLVGLAVLVVAGAAVPAALGRITPAGVTLDVPDYWGQTAAWLEEESGGRNALVLPGAPFGDYLWGSPKDEPLQYLAQSRWAVRNVIPLAPPGNIRMLDAVEQRLAQGDGSPGLVAFLQRAGVQHLVVRNDLSRGGDVPDPTLVHQALADSPGLQLVASFGPEVGGGATLEGDGGDRVVVNGGWQARYPAVEVYEVPGPVDVAVAAAAPTVVVGGPEDLLDLADLGLVGSAPTLLAADVTDIAATTDADAPLLLTDGLRARERFFARIHDGDSATLTPGDVPRSGNPSRDYRIDTDDRWSTTAVLSGATGLSASSSASDADAFGGVRPGQLPYAAVDGAVDTQWVSGIGRSEQSWWRVDLEEPVPAGRVTLVGGAQATEDQVVRVVTEAGASEPVELAAGETRVVVAPPGATGWIRVEDATGVEGRAVALAEVDVPGLDVRRRLVLPALPDGWPVPTAIVLRADQDARRGCLEVAGDVRCVQGADRQGEEPTSIGRLVTLPEASSWNARLTVLPRGGAALDTLVQADQPLNISASSVAVPDPRGSPLSAVDGDPATTWISDAEELRPTLRLSWLGKRRISSVRMELDEETAARQAVRVTVGWPGGAREVEVSSSGLVTFPAIRTDQLSIRVEQADATTDLGFDTTRRDIGVGVTELTVPGVDYLPLALSPDVRTYACGTGPDVQVDGQSVATAVQASPRQLAAGAAVPAVTCGATPGVPALVELGPGGNVVDVEGNTAFAVSSLVLVREASEPASATPLLLRSSSDTLTIEGVPAGAQVVALRQNANPGWDAVQAEEDLEPLVLDGWQQGWVLDDDDPVVATFAPDRTYRAGLLLGLILLAGLAAGTAVGAVRRRRNRDLPPSLAERPVPPVGLVGLAVLASGLIAGWGGVLVGGLVVILLVALRRSEARDWVVAAPAVVVGAAYAVRPWGSTSGWAGSDAWTAYAMVVPLVGLLLLLAFDERSGTSRLRRRAGRSTRR